jgi:hypothetical protein
VTPLTDTMCLVNHKSENVSISAKKTGMWIKHLDQKRTWQVAASYVNAQVLIGTLDFFASSPV